jgi:hypothetical protein
MRLVEIALLLIPVGVVVAWLCGLRGLSQRGVVAVALVFSLMAGALYLLGDARVFHGTYVPARLNGTQIVPERSS